MYVSRGYTPIRVPSRPRTHSPTAVLTSIAVSLALLLSACGDDSDSSIDVDPTAVIEDYRLAYNSGDIQAVMSLFNEVSVITGHPFAASQRGLDEIRRIQSQDIASATTEDAYVFSNFEVDGERVTWDHVWTRGDGREFCVDGHVAVIQVGKIMSWTWPDTGFGCP